MHLVYDLAELQTLIAQSPQDWRPLVFTNGCFDLIHVGHVRYLAAAKALGKTLVVGVNSDTSVQQLKGNTRPYVPEAQRAEVLAALKSVDAVVIFSEVTAVAIIEAIAPDIYVKGGDYTPETLPETPAVKACGASLELIKVEIPTSTTKIVQKILNNSQSL
ncbi:D-glycero-beta-D-manno-heptose 1-phosphate adenylyltransferase [Tumidithrix helvetica PCC 7403]|uniref:D-glycero-beta-D-manno-heptose 1-phosphate adenylyltransferase n=1 Tax=Tumidithrix helvetica TaxID=3457545 RepID=UPI003CAB7778